jgi:enoyl-CoA hydratase
MSEKSDSVLVEVRDFIMQITFNRPDTLNAIDQEMHHTLVETLNGLAGRRDVRVVVLASTGKHFSAGGDLNEVFRIQESAEVRQTFQETGRALMNALLDVPVPVVVALHGDAHGLGANIVLACDMVVAAKRARLSDTHVVAGMVAGDGGCVVWPQAMGMMWAKRHLLTGQFIGAEQAYARGLVTDLVETSEEALPAARALAERIASLPPVAVQGTKRSLNRVMQQRAGEVFEYSLALEQISLLSSDIREAVNAFKEKRKPVYKGE